MIQFRVLGSVDLRGQEGETLLSLLAQPKRVALLAYLAVATPHGFHRRDKLLGLFWPERDQEHARGALRNALYFLRRCLGDEVLVSRGDEEVGLAEGAVWCDAVAFEKALAAGDLEKGVSLYAGPLLDGFQVSGADEFEHWLEAERQRLAERFTEGLQSLAERAEEGKEYEAAVAWWKRLVAVDPYNSRYVLRLMEALVTAGDPANALQHAREHERLLREELGVEPDAELLTSVARLRREPQRHGGEPVGGAVTPAGQEWVPETLPAEDRAEAPRVPLLQVLATYALVSVAVLVAVHISTLQFGLPDWFFPGAVVMCLVCLPIIVATALVQGAPVGSSTAAVSSALPPNLARRWLTWRNAISVVALAFALLVVAVSGFMTSRVMGIGPWGTLITSGVLEERDVIVLADFDEHAGDSTLALALTNLVRVDLEQSPAVRVADDDYVGRVLQRMERDPDTLLTSDLAREVAIREGLKAVVTGEIDMLGSSYVLSLRLVAAETGETLASFQETASDLDATIPAVNRMSRELRERVGESLKTIRSSPPLSQARTASLEALRLQTEARRANMRGEYGQALDLLNRAIEIDTAFAEAYRLRSSVLGNLGTGRAQAIADATRAYELRHRLPLWERYWVESQYHRKVTGDYERAITLHRALLNLRPDHASAWVNLGIVYLDLRDNARAEEALRHALEMLDSLSGAAWYNLAVSLFDQGKYDETWETLRRWEAKMPGHPNVPEMRAHVASALGDYDGAEAHYRDYLATAPGSLRRRGEVSGYLAALAGVRGRVGEAERHERDAMQAYEQAGLIRLYLNRAVWLARSYHWIREMPDRALAEFDAALERHPFSDMAPLDRPYLNVARFYAEAGSPGRAKDLIAEHEVAVDPTPRRASDHIPHLAFGRVALAESRPVDAIEEIQLAIQRTWSPITGLTTLGQAYEMAGEPDSAIAVYERYVNTPFHARVTYDSVRLPFVYGRLGDLCEQRGDTAKAIYYYGRLVELWKDADPELQPRVEAARRAIRSLSPDT